MDKISRKTYKDWIWIIALTIMVICLIEGLVFYWDTENKFLMVLFNIQNAIKAYKIDPDIKIKDAFSFMESHQGNTLITIIGYVYSLAVIVAPFCTIAALALLVSVPFRFLKGTFNRHKKNTLLIIGDGEAKKHFIENASSGDYRVYSIEKKALDEKTKIDYITRGIKYFQMYSDQSYSFIFAKISLENIHNILVCDEDALQNLVILKQIDKELEKYSNMQNKPQIYITCADAGSGNIIKKFYDDGVNRKTKDSENHVQYDLYIVDIKKNAVSRMFENYPIHGYNDEQIKKTGVIESDSFDVHMGILGFGEFGQKTLIEAMNMSVLSPDSNIVFDVYDINMKKVLGSFLKQFSPKVLDELITGDGISTPYRSFEINNDNGSSKYRCDGNFVINFWDIDAETLEFTKILAECNERMPFTYIVVALDNEKRMASSVIELDRLISSINEEKSMPTVVIRTKEKGEIYTIIDSGNGYIVPFLEKDNIYSFDYVKDTKIVDRAKMFNYRYNQIGDVVYNFSSKSNSTVFIELLNDDAGAILAEPIGKILTEVNIDDVNTMWLKTNFYKRESSIAQSKHQAVKKWLFGNENTSVQKIVSMAENQYASKKYKERIEHRRWNMYMFSHGYCYDAVRNDRKMLHDCLTDFETLIVTRPDTLEYDYTPYMLL